jgi:hypothetical protein
MEGERTDRDSFDAEPEGEENDVEAEIAPPPGSVERTAVEVFGRRTLATAGRATTASPTIGGRQRCRVEREYCSLARLLTVRFLVDPPRDSRSELRARSDLPSGGC